MNFFLAWQLPKNNEHEPVLLGIFHNKTVAASAIDHDRELWDNAYNYEITEKTLDNF